MNHLRIDTVPHHASFSAFNRIRLILLTTLVLFFKLESGRATDLDSSFTPAGSVASPDKAVVFELGTVADGHLAWRVNWQGTQVIAPSRAGILLGENNTGANATVSASSLRSFVETFSTRHLQKSVSLAGTAAEFPVNIPGGPAWTFEVRLFNQGVAWRMRVPGSGSRHVSGESTDFVLPPATTVYANPDTVSYEGLHVKSAIETLQLRNDVGMPMTFELPGARFAALTESHVMHYSGMTLGTTGSNRLIGKFRDDPKGWDMDGDIDSPWRIVLLGENLNELLHASAIVEAVAPPPNSELFPNGSATEWIKPGRSLWQWWAFNDPGTHWSKQKEFVDKAAELKCEYYLVDEGWEHERQEWFKPGNPDGAWATLKELADYAAPKGVRLWVWRGWRPDTKKQWVGLETPEKRTEFFRRCREAGVAGVKIDFMDSESHERLAFYEACLLAAAKERIMVNFHGANKPTGEARTWPHEMTREAVRGLEYNKFGSLPPAHYTTVPFTHMLAGHIDFTPTTLNPAFFKGTTAALQLASAVVFSSPVLSWADDPALYLQSPAVDVIRDMPVEWDETRVLPPSAIGEVVLMARRHGQEWWIAAMNGGTARQFDVNLAALAGKEAVIDTFLEGKKPHEFDITRDAPIPESGLIHLAIKSGSGALIRIKPSPHPKITAPGHTKGPTEAFLMAYFVGDSVEENRMHLCWSLDGLKWTALNNDKPVVTSSMSTKAIRDPAILRKEDGTFVLMYTDSAWSVGQKPTCGFWDSPDLVNWSNQRIRALSSNRAVPAWGPEAIYDPATGKYIVLWCTARSDSLWYNTTTDFNTFSPEAQFFSPGYQVLENNIFQHGEYYYLIYKDERGKNSADTPYKALKVARSKSLTPGSFTTITDNYISPHLSEGPVICKAINSDRWYLYYDMFMEGGIFKCSTTTNLDGNTSEWSQLPDNQFSLPKRVRNGHIIEIDREELNRLRDVWDNGPNFAEGCKASASSAGEGSPASNANDLNYNTCWSAAAGTGANEWLEINLGTNRTFNKTILRQSNSDRITGYKIQYHNGTEWLDAYTGGPMGTKVKIDTFPPVTASKVRLLVTAVQPAAAAGGGTDTCPQINEFDIYLNPQKLSNEGK